VELDDPLGKNDGSVEGKRWSSDIMRFGISDHISFILYIVIMAENAK
jgi:dynactin complex subunit